MNCTNPQTIWPHRSVEWCDLHEEYPVSVPCGKCIPCLVNKRNDWSFRLKQEYKSCKHGKTMFVTLTYDQKHVPADGQLCKRHLQLFLKRLRKKTNGSKTSGIRYYGVGEYGSISGRPHYHILLFGAEEQHVRSSWCDGQGRPVGIVHVGSVTSASVAYVTKYIVQPDIVPSGYVKPFAVMSRAYGIGGHYLTDEMVAWHKSDDKNYAIRDGQKIRLPRFYRSKIWYHPEDRERVSRAGIALGIQAREAERAYYENEYGLEHAESKRREFELAVIQRVKSKVSYSQTL